MDWTKKNNTIEKNFEFKNFISAVDFVNKVAQIAETANHHPDILIHGYKNVKVTLTTHSEGKVTDKDLDLSKKIDELYEQFEKSR